MIRNIDLRQNVIRTALSLTRQGLNHGTSGNVSVRCGEEGYLITPSGVPAESLLPQDIVYMDFDGEIEGRLQPSTEWHFHAALLRERPDLNAVIHTHAPFCTTLAVLSRPIPAFHYMIAKAGGNDIRVAPYATFGTPELCAHALTAMQDRRACLLAQHGMIAAHGSLEAALALTIEVEDLARLYWQALQIAEPPVLDDAEMARVLEKFRTYGTRQGR